MTRKKVILKSTLSNILLNVVQMGTQFLLLPLVLAYFGKEIFGINAYIASILLIFNFFSIAISMSLMKFVPELITQNNNTLLNDLIISILCVSLSLHIFLGLGIIVFAHVGLGWFNIPIELMGLAQRATELVGAFVILQFSAPVISGILTGLNEFHLRNKITLVSIFFSILAYVFVQYTNSSLIVYILILQIGTMIQVLINAYYAYIKLPFKVKLTKPNFSGLKGVLNFNLFLIANRVSEHLMYTADTLIIQKFLGSAVVAEYHIAKRVNDLAHTFNSLPLGAILPSLSAAFANNDKDFLHKINVQGGVIYNLIAVPPLLAIYGLMDQFIVLWIGEQFEQTILCARLFILTLIIAAPFKVFSYSLLAKGRVVELGWVRFVYAVINFIASYYLCQKIGLLGVVLPTVFGWLFVFPVTLLYLMYSEDFLKVNQFIRNLLPCVITLGIIQAMYSYNFILFFNIENWFGLFLHLFAYYLFTSICIYSFTPKFHKTELLKSASLWFHKLKISF